MQTLNTQFEHELVKLINEEVRRIEGILGAGKLKEIADYRDFCGQIAGLLRVISYCEEVNKLLSER